MDSAGERNGRHRLTKIISKFFEKFGECQKRGKNVFGKTVERLFLEKSSVSSRAISENLKINRKSLFFGKRSADSQEKFSNIFVFLPNYLNNR